MPRIVILDGYTLNPGDNPWDALRTLGDVKIFDRSKPEDLISRAGEAEILVINKFKLGEDEFKCLPNLKYIAVTATGYDCIDVQAARNHDIGVCNVPVYGTDSVAQYVFAMLLHICHRIDVHDTAIRQGKWQECGDFCFWELPLVELVGMKLGIVGFGRIGRRIGQLANAFGMQVLAHSPRHVDTPSYDPFRWVDLDTLAADSDVISLNCRLTDDTKHIINADFLNRCKRSLILLNAGRGPLINESDLAEALNSERIAAAGLDVVSQEPINNDNPLLNAKNCFLTPHLAWGSLSARQRLMKTTAENIGAFLNGEPINLVN